MVKEMKMSNGIVWLVTWIYLKLLNDFTHFDDDISAYGNLSDEEIVAVNRTAEED